MNTTNDQGLAHLAMARAKNLSISTKQSVEISKCLRYKTTAYAKRFLEEVIKGRRAVPFRSFNQDTGHKPGMAAGRYPQKAAKEFLKLVKSVEANAQVKGLDVGHLKITKLVANKASIPLTGGRVRHGAKRSHLEVEVKELGTKAKKGQPASSTNAPSAKDAKKEMEGKKETPQAFHQPTHQLTSTPQSPSPHQSVPAHQGTAARDRSVAELTPVKHLDQKHSEHMLAEKGAAKEVVKEAAKEMPMRQPISEPSSADLLKQVQAKAAVFNQSVKERAEVGKVEDLYGELQKKGTLRGKS